MNPEYQSILAAGVEKKYRHLENEIMKDVVRRIQKTGKITSTADWQLQRYMILGHSTEDVENIVRSAVGGDYVDTFRLYDEVIEQEYVRSKEMYEQVNALFVPYEQNLELQQLTNALIQQSNDELFNITKSMGFMVDMGNGRKAFTPLSEYYNDYLDNAVLEMASGAFDYNTLIRKVVGQMTASGLRSVDYASGHSNRVDVAARRALLTGMGQLTGHISDRNGAALGTDYFEIDWHPGSRPDHAAWQGRVWSKQELITVCGLGTGPGLLGWNCRHTYYPFIKGVSQRAYSDQWLAEMDRKEAQTKTFRGKEYNTYQATQKQRSMETAMRAQRQKVQLLQQGKADPDDIINAKCKYQAQLDEYKEFSKKFNLPEQRERIYADLRGRVAPSQRTYKQWQAEQERKARERAEQKRRADMRAAERAAKAAQAAKAAKPPTKAFTEIMDFIKKSGVERVPVKKLEKPLTTEQIIEKLAGADRTKGSCSSLAFSYIANKCGLDVTDFRGGSSQSVFSLNANIYKFLELDGVKGSLTKVQKEISGTMDIINSLEYNKEYYLATGRHAAIIRRMPYGDEYLELQSGYENGWQALDYPYGTVQKTLAQRFGCRKTQRTVKMFGSTFKFDSSVVVMEVDSFKDNSEFAELMEYINTATDKQQKGAGGGVK